MGYPNRKENNTSPYKDYLEWPEEEWWELIEGVAHARTSSPSRSHQKISVALVKKISQYLEGIRCELYHVPFDVRLTEGDEEDGEIKTVV